MAQSAGVGTDALAAASIVDSVIANAEGVGTVQIATAALATLLQGAHGMATSDDVAAAAATAAAAVTAEAARAATAEDALTVAVGARALTSDLAAEATARVASDAALSATIADLSAQITASGLVADTWTAALALTGTWADGQGLEVLDADAGTHLQATATGYDGASVGNGGRYRRVAAWGRWLRVGDTGLLALDGRLDDLEGALTSSESVSGSGWVDGYYIYRTTGVATANSGYAYQYFDVTAGDTILVSATVSGVNTALCVWYNGASYLSSSLQAPSGTTTAYTDYEIVVPTGATKVALCVPLAYKATAGIKVSGALMTDAALRITDLAAALDGEASERVSGDAALDARVDAQVALLDALDVRLDGLEGALSSDESVSGSGWVDGYYIYRTTGVATANSGYAYQYFDVTSGDTLLVSATISGASTALCVWYTGASYLSSSLQAPSGTTTAYTDYEIVVPTGATKVALCVPLAYKATAGIKVSGALMTDAALRITDLGAALDTQVALLDARLDVLEGGGAGWAGKSIVWIGNSIPTGTDAGGRYPDIIASLLGCTVYRETTGGMAFRGGVRSLVTGGDPYGWTGKPYAGILWSLGLTHDDKQYLIDNWAAWQPLLAGSPPATLSSSQQAQALATSYETRLVANHLGSNRRDLYVFDNPYNDRAMANDLETAGVGGEDVLTYLGVMNKMIRIIREDNPAAKIIIVGHYEDQLQPTIPAAQQAVADYWSIPIIPLWSALGWSQRTITVDGSWIANGDSEATYTWTAGTGSQTMTVLARMVPDGVHPSKDASGAPTARIAAILAEAISRVR